MGDHRDNRQAKYRQHEKVWIGECKYQAARHGQHEIKHQEAENTTDGRGQNSNGNGLARFALLGQGITVKSGCRRSRFTWRIEKNRRYRTTVGYRAVCGYQQDNGRVRPHAECQRNQKGQGDAATQPGQYADQKAEYDRAEHQQHQIRLRQ